MHTDILQPIPIDGQPTLCWPWDYLKRQEWMNLQLHPFCHPFVDRSQAILPNPMNISSGIFAPWQVMFHFHFPHVLIHQYLADLFGAKAICKSLSWALWEDVKMNKPWFVPTGSLLGQPPFFIMVPRRFRKARQLVCLLTWASQNYFLSLPVVHPSLGTTLEKNSSFFALHDMKYWQRQSVFLFSQVPRSTFWTWIIISLAWTDYLLGLIIYIISYL